MLAVTRVHSRRVGKRVGHVVKGCERPPPGGDSRLGRDEGGNVTVPLTWYKDMA